MTGHTFRLILALTIVLAPLAAEALGLTLPPPLLFQADEVIR
jgi:hypothetical protein